MAVMGTLNMIIIEFILFVAYKAVSLPVMAAMIAKYGEKYGIPKNTNIKAHPNIVKFSIGVKMCIVKLISIIMSKASTAE